MIDISLYSHNLMIDWYCVDGVRRSFALVILKRHGASECNGDSECPVSEFQNFPGWDHDF